jgi:DNA polymerase-3 subunit delta'
MAFSTIINQNRAKEIIRGQLSSGRIPHGYLFLGPEGVGRRKMALELAKALICTGSGNTPDNGSCDRCEACRKVDASLHPDVQTIDFAWQARLEDKEEDKQRVIKIDTIRALQKEINLTAVESAWKIYLIEPAEKITLDAANCLLKTLEEPPAKTMIILIARHKENLPVTIVSRTQIVTFNPLMPQEIRDFLLLHSSCGLEKATDIANKAEGSLSWAVERAGDSLDLSETSLAEIVNGTKSAADLLAVSRQNAKNAGEFLAELLADAKQVFRADPANGRRAVELLLESKKMLERNVNAQMVLDVLLLRLRYKKN